MDENIWLSSDSGGRTANLLGSKETDDIERQFPTAKVEPDKEFSFNPPTPPANNDGPERREPDWYLVFLGGSYLVLAGYCFYKGYQFVREGLML